MPLDTVAVVGAVTEVPRGAFVGLGIADGVQTGVDVTGDTGVAGEGWEGRGVAASGTSTGSAGGSGGSAGGVAGGGGRRRGRGGHHSNNILFDGGGLPGDGEVFVVGDLDGVEDGVVHEDNVLGVGGARKGAAVKGFAFVSDPSAPRERLADATVNADDDLHTFGIGDLAGACSGESEEAGDAAVDGRKVEAEIGGFEVMKVVEGGKREDAGGGNGEFRHHLEESRTVLVGWEVGVLVEDDLEVAFEAGGEALKHGKRILFRASIGPECEGGGDVEDVDGVVFGEEIMGGEVENAVRGWGIPFCFVGSFLEGGEERRELKDRTVPLGTKGSRGMSHRGGASARGHIKRGGVIKER